MTIKLGDLEALAQEKIDSDVDFQTSLENLSDDEKTQALSDKKQELINSELAAIEEKASKAEKNYENQKIRAEKAEAEAKRPKEKETPKNELPKKDQILEVRALNSLHEDDIDEVVAIAEAKNISLSEAIKSPYVKAFIKTREDERKTAQATSTSSSRKTSSKADTQSLVKKASNYLETGGLSPEEMPGAASALIDEIFGKK